MISEEQWMLEWCKKHNLDIGEHSIQDAAEEASSRSMKMIEVEVLGEYGIAFALRGLALSYDSKSSMKVADNLAFKGDGHNKFLESIDVWIEATLPRSMWQQYDTYRIGVTKQSQSTMHTILRKPLAQEHFNGKVYKSTIKKLNRDIKKKDFKSVKDNLPESFLQKRVVKVDYKTLQSMERQRRSHKLKEWQEVLDAVLGQVEHPEWIQKGE
ncbi:MAG: hypothetical protein WC148_05715 [Bacilli bacterium]